MIKRKKILTVCLVGISRSVGLADVLKLHFQPVDVIPVGVSRAANGIETLRHLINDWADHVVFMETSLVEKARRRLGSLPENKIHLCDVGADVYGHGTGNRPILIDKVWRWTRANQGVLGISEYFSREDRVYKDDD